MKQINNYEELREYCLGKGHNGLQRYVCCIGLRERNQLFTLWSSIEPKFKFRTWNVDDYFKQTEMCNGIELTFDCDFSKCIWAV